MKSISKIFIPLGVIAALAAVAYAIWYFAISPRIAATLPELSAELAKKESKINVPVALSNDKVFDYWIYKSTGDVYYLTEDGQIRKINSDGAQTAVSDQIIAKLTAVIPSADGSMALVEFGYPNSPTFAVYNVNANTWQPLPAGTTAAAWNPQSNNQIAYLKNTGAANQLFILNLNDRKASEILKLSQKDLILEWIQPDVIYLKERPSALLANSLWAFNLKTKTFAPMIKNEPGLLIKWSPNGTEALKFTGSTAKNRALTMIDSRNQVLSSSIIETLPSKCAFTAENLYCAVPEEIPAAALLPDDYLKRQVYFQDAIYSLPLIDEGRGGVINLPFVIFDARAAEFTTPLDADQLTTQNNALYFINRYDKKLYRLEL